MDRPGEALDGEFEALRRQLGDPEIAELLACLVINLGMHIVLSTFDFYPMLGPAGGLLTQAEARALYGPAPAPLPASV